MKQTKNLLDNCSEKYKRTYTELSKHIKENNKCFKANIHIEKIDFKIMRGILYSFFDSFSILISINPNDISTKDGKTKCTWFYLIYIEGSEIIEGGFHTREEAEHMAFIKSFQFLDTQLFIEYTKSRFFDETSNVSCLSVNWEQLNRVLAHKRKNLLT